MHEHQVSTGAVLDTEYEQTPFHSTLIGYRIGISDHSTAFGYLLLMAKLQWQAT